MHHPSRVLAELGDPAQAHSHRETVTYGLAKDYEAADGKTNKAENSRNIHTYSLKLPISQLEEKGWSVSCNDRGKS